MATAKEQIITAIQSTIPESVAVEFLQAIRQVDPPPPVGVQPIMWLKADVGVYQDAARTIPAVDGSSVMGWADQSGVGNHASQPVTSKAPTLKANVFNGKSAISFNGANNLLHTWTNGAAAFTAIIVARRNGSLSNYNAIFTSNKGFISARQIGSPNWGMYLNGDVTAGYSMDNQSRVLSAVVRNYNDVDLVTNGIKEIKTSGAGWYGVGNFIGSGESSSQYFAGDIAEIIVYNVALSDADRTSMEAYLSTKYNVPFSLGAEPYTVTVNNMVTIREAISDPNWYARPSVKVVNGVVVLLYRGGNGHIGSDGGLHIKFSSDYGITWTNEDKYVDGLSVTNFPMTPANDVTQEGELILCPNGDLLLHMFAGQYGITAHGTHQSRSTDGGKTWSVSEPMNISGIADVSFVYAIEDSFVYNNVIYIGTRIWQDATCAVGKSALLKSPDNGVTWQWISDISTFAQNTNEVGLEYLGNNKIIAVLRTSSSPLVLVSNDMGATWEITSSTLESGGKHRVYTAAHLKGAPNWWTDPFLIMSGFVNFPTGRRTAIWLSPDAGQHWTTAYFVHEVTPDSGYSDVFYNPSTNEYVVMTYYGSMSKADIRQYNLSIV